jgi:hypothetical protein
MSASNKQKQKAAANRQQVTKAQKFRVLATIHYLLIELSLARIMAATEDATPALVDNEATYEPVSEHSAATDMVVGCSSDTKGAAMAEAKAQPATANGNSNINLDSIDHNGVFTKSKTTASHHISGRKKAERASTTAVFVPNGTAVNGQVFTSFLKCF